MLSHRKDDSVAHDQTFTKWANCVELMSEGVRSRVTCKELVVGVCALL